MLLASMAENSDGSSVAIYILVIDFSRSESGFLLVFPFLFRLHTEYK